MRLRAFRLHPVGREAMEALVRTVAEADVALQLPLPPRTFVLGPLRRRIADGHRVELHLRIRDGCILRREAEGAVRPPFQLPLGFKLTGLRLSDRGEVLLQVTGLPDLNLSRLTSRVPVIPESAADLVQMLRDLHRAPRDRQEQEPTVDLDHTEDLSGTEDLEGTPEPAGEPPPSFSLTLTRLRPHPDTRLELGEAGTLELGPETVVDMTVAGSRVELKGVLHVVGGNLAGPELTAEGVRGHVELGMERGEGIRRTWLQSADFTADRFQVGKDADPGWALSEASIDIPRLVLERDDEGWEGEGAVLLSGRGGVRVPPSASSARWLHRSEDATQHLELHFEKEK